MAKKKTKSPQKETLFKESLVPAKPGSDRLFEVSYDDSQPVECLGMTFPNDDARREYFLDKLREKLKDPEFRKIEGFPIGEDEDILALSDPPYYTACPNPFVADFIRLATTGQTVSTEYRREPFTWDVTEGKNDPIYNAHPYHTKVPPRAIEKYISHYTSPGDIILDFTCGTGMTGVASHLTATNEAEQRNTILCDLSPIATWISYGLNRLVEPSAVENARSLMSDVISHVSNNYLCNLNGNQKTLLYLIWSDQLVCSNCSQQFTFWDVAIDPAEGTIHDDFQCPHCSAVTSKRLCSVATTTEFDHALKKASAHAVRVPVIAVFQKGRRNDRQFLSRDSRHAFVDLNDDALPDIPRLRIDSDLDIWLDRDYRQYGIYSIDRFFTNRALRGLADAKRMFRDSSNYRAGHFGLWLLTAILRDCSLMTGLDIKKFFHGGGGPFSGGVKGTFFVPSLAVEKNVAFALANRLDSLDKVAQRLGRRSTSSSIITTQSATDLQQIPPDTVDYIFVDPPFGSNFIYSELNTIHEAWLGVRTASQNEAVIHRRRKTTATTLEMYQDLMRTCFSEAFRVLKPGRWMTIEFSNTQAAVWNALQASLQEVGFIVANVAALDKKQGSFKAVTTTTAVKQDLVLSVYKPSEKFEESFALKAGTEAGVWEFVRHHLGNLPVVFERGERIEIIAERLKYLLFDRLVSFHLQRGISLPMSAPEFYQGLAQKYPERDGMYFLPEQLNQYDSARTEVNGVQQLELFVSNEASAILWIRQILATQQMTYQELSPLFMKEAQRVWEKHEQPLELKTLLEQNFVEGPGGKWCLPDPKNESHLHQIRQRHLLKEFEQYVGSKGKLKIVRSEALRAGFKDCWQRKDYNTILQLAKKIPDAVIQEDQALLMYFDNASLMQGE